MSGENVGRSIVPHSLLDDLRKDVPVVGRYPQVSRAFEIIPAQSRPVPVDASTSDPLSLRCHLILVFREPPPKKVPTVFPDDY